MFKRHLFEILFFLLILLSVLILCPLAITVEHPESIQILAAQILVVIPPDPNFECFEPAIFSIDSLISLILII